MRSPLIAAVFLAVFLVLALANIRTLLPWCDEGWFADPAYHLMTRGVLATVTLDPTATFRSVRFDGIHERTYWIMPLYPVVQAAWYNIAGFGLFSMRALSTLCALLALGAWFGVLRLLFRNSRVALAGLALLSLDFHFLWSASVGRMDMPGFALGSTGLAAYLLLRERKFALALLAGHALVAASIFCHPNCILFFADLCFLAVYFDRSRLRLSSAFLSAIPYLAGLAGWGAYILQAPDAFLAQFLGNAGNAADRFLIFTAPWTSLKNEIVLRYLANFGMPPYSSGAGALKLGVLAGYVAGALGCLTTPALRRDRGARALLAMAALHMVLLMLLDGFKQFLYMIYVAPGLALLLAVFLSHHWEARSIPRPLLAAAAGLVLLVDVAVTAGRIRQDPYHKRFLAAAAYLKGRAGPQTTVMGSAEMAFELGFDGQLTDDYRLGYRSGKKPHFIVLDEPRYASWIPLLEQQDPANYRYIQNLLATEYRQVFEAPGYRILERR